MNIRKEVQAVLDLMDHQAVTGTEKQIEFNLDENSVKVQGQKTIQVTNEEWDALMSKVFGSDKLGS